MRDRQMDAMIRTNESGVVDWMSVMRDADRVCSRYICESKNV